jgi:hypothetical protein
MTLTRVIGFFPSFSVFEGFLTLGPDRGKERGRQRDHGNEENSEADRAAEKDYRVNVGNIEIRVQKNRRRGFLDEGEICRLKFNKLLWYDREK